MVVDTATPIAALATLDVISETVRIVHDGRAILVLKRKSIAGIFDRIDNALRFARSV
jgi:hypothetical protein